MSRLMVDPSDIERMANKTLLSYGTNAGAKVSQFWILLALAGVIAGAGVVADSTATVIGAMIVAPLMTPILGTSFALVIADRRRMLRSLLTVVVGAALVVAIGFLFGLVDPLGTFTEENSQVTSCVSPALIDLIAALATGLVGAFALVRSDVSDALPGVAIAISLVPPLVVVGLTFEDGKTSDSLGALLLFGTNVTAIIFTATMVLLLYKVRHTAESSGYPVGHFSGLTMAAVIAAVALVAVPLALGTQEVVRQEVIRAQAGSIAADWAESNGWRLADVAVDGLTMTVSAVGPPPTLSPESLRQELDDAGYSEVDLVVRLIAGGVADLAGTSG